MGRRSATETITAVLRAFVRDPGDVSHTSAREAAAVTQGFILERKFGRYKSDDFFIWDGKRRELAAQALAEPDGVLPDVLGLQEIENLDAVRRFNEGYLGGEYPYALLIDGWDPRNIDVAVLSKLPILEVRSHIDDRNKSGHRLFS